MNGNKQLILSNILVFVSAFLMLFTRTLLFKSKLVMPCYNVFLHFVFKIILTAAKGKMAINFSIIEIEFAIQKSYFSLSVTMG